MNTSTIIATEVIPHKGRYTYANHVRITLFPDFFRLGYIFAPPQATEAEIQKLNSAIDQDFSFDENPELAAVWDGFGFVMEEIDDLLGIRVANPNEVEIDLVAAELEEFAHEVWVDWTNGERATEEFNRLAVNDDVELFFDWVERTLYDIDESEASA